MAQQSMTSRMWAILSPVLVVVALTALSQVRLEVPRVIIEPPVIETRDRFMSVAVVGDVVWAVGKDGKIIRSEDAGKTWVRQTTGLHTNFQSIAAWDDQNAVVVANEGKGLVTADGGETWQADLAAGVGHGQRQGVACSPGPAGARLGGVRNQRDPALYRFRQDLGALDADRRRRGLERHRLHGRGDRMRGGRVRPPGVQRR